jgi:transcriptional regulator with XRE-family HTH domain
LQIVQALAGYDHPLLDLDVDAMPGLTNRIREIRRAAKLTLDQLAERMGVDPSTVSRLEKGEVKISAEYLRALAAALGRHPLEFIGDPAEWARSDAEREALAVMRELDPEVARGWLAAGKHLRPRE